ncbi:MAG: hypothetical protein IK093_04220 [Ruminiclostridium sp.]|nr:hypothetical protein [Ruminiclostridium sp.]
MKITPVKNYKAPKYAAKIAAVLALTAAASGCLGPQTSGAAASYETTPSVTENTNTVKLNGGADTDTTKPAETDCPELEGTIPSPEYTELEGDVAVPTDPDNCKPEVTTSVAAAGFIGLKDIINFFKGGGDKEPNVRLEGDVPMMTDDEDEEDYLEGMVPALTDDGEDEIIELAGDVAVEDEYEYPIDIYFAKYCSYELEYATETLEGDLMPINYDRDTPELESGQFRQHYTYTRELPGSEPGNEKYEDLNISFVSTDSELWERISASPEFQKVSGGYVSDKSYSGETPFGGIVLNEGRLLLIGVDYNDEPLSEEFCKDLVSDLLAKGVIK